MTTTENDEITRSEVLSSAVHVMLTAAGLQIKVPFAGKSPPRLDLGALTLLQSLASRDGRTSEDRVQAAAHASGRGVGSLRKFVDRLSETGLIIPDTRPPRHLSAPPVVEPNAGELASVDLDLTTMTKVQTPLVLVVTHIGFELYRHDGGLAARFTPAELSALAELRAATALGPALATHRTAAGIAALSEEDFLRLARRLVASGLARTYAPGEPISHLEESLFDALDERGAEVRTEFVRAMERRRERTEDDDPGRRTGLTSVIPVTFNDVRPPFALGLIISYARAYDEGRLQRHYDFVRDWVVDRAHLRELAQEPCIFLFSNYLWSHRECLEVSAEVKATNPGSVTIHGGPNTPKYQGDVEAYFAEHPHVDITVRGEGEATAAEVLDALSSTIGAERPDLSALADVAGISYRDGDRIVHTPDRERIADLDSIPSPYLTGLFDIYQEVPAQFAIIETNRGCPYGCTFCDWGSATLSRIRKFDLERVFAELEWCARNKVEHVGVADANFGIWERDVEIAERFVELNREYGYPKLFGVNFAKNTAKHLKRIIEMLVAQGIVTEGVLSLQSMDAGTLNVIERSNIKLEKYEELAAQFRAAKLPIHVDIMMGLPGQSVTTFKNDLQECIDREVAVNIPATELLVNSPMNEPSYREKHKIQISPSGTVVSTATFTRDEYRHMGRLREMFLLCDNFGVLRQVSRWVRQEIGLREIDLYDQLLQDSQSDRERWPALAFTTGVVPRVMAPPASWSLFIAELRDYLTSVVGLADDRALESVLTTQHALLPDRNRRFPDQIELAHDFAAWHAAMIAAKDSGHRRDWTEVVPRLSTYPPAVMTVDDPASVSRYAIGHKVTHYALGLSWELDSPISRPSSFGTLMNNLFG